MYILFQDGCKIRTDIDVLPFSVLKSSVSPPNPLGYPKKITTIGQHIRAWRVRNNLVQSDIAKCLGVCEDTIVGWEVRNNNPLVRHMPAIIRLIGYLPIEIDTSTFGGRIAMYRFKNGLTLKRLGHFLSVDASTVRAWEGSKNTPPKNRIGKIEEFLAIQRPVEAIE